MSRITLLDGGMGQELVHRSGDRPTNLWSTRVMLDHPGLVAEVHRDFFAAGATVASTNSYAIHRDRLEGTGLEGQFEALHACALAEAVAARDAAGGGRIAGCIGPLRASYRPDIHPPAAEAAPLYAEVARILAPDCDLLICETVASVDQARGVLAGAAAAGLPVWLALTVQDADGSRLRSGEPLSAVLEVAQEGAEAVLANCSAPEAMPAALAVLAQSGLPFGAYANGFVRISADFLIDRPTVDALTGRTDLPPEVYAGHVMRWVDMGASIVGGCCETGPAHIAAVAAALRAAGHEIT